MSPYGRRDPFLRSPLPPSCARPVREPERPGDGRNLHADPALRRGRRAEHNRRAEDDRQREGGDENAALAARAPVRA
ncbi:hypothetical protein [Microbispora catharanthi]|uniref:Uncharacterized protein n=1 Tax=Microbispora catharanthi TaxID=1712871 RepID=A0A5N6B5N8_9ACTN|nr:hypothetical protein [Microbispora catharanthi]KAB8175378.1 hypothetical protein FH610_039475 [Microbispora catharanthi]